MSDVLAAVRDACDRMVAAESAKDLDGVRALIWDDAVWLPPNANPVEGIDNVIALFADFFETVPYNDVTVSRMEISASESGDMASVWVTFELVVDSPDGPAEAPMSALMTWEKRDGEWKVTANMFTSTLPPENS